MDKKLTFPGGEPDITIDNLLRDPIANRAALFALAQGLAAANGTRVSGAAVTVNAGVDASVTAGYVWLNGEILQVDAATVTETLGSDLWEFQKEVTYDSAGDKTFNNAIPRQTYQKNRAILVNVATVTGVGAVNARPLVYDSGWLDLTAISGNVTILLNGGKVKQIGRNVSGYVAFTVDSTVASGLQDLFQLPSGVDYIGTDNRSRITAISVTSTQKGAACTNRANGVLRVFDGSDLVVGETYQINFSYNV